MVSGKSTCYGSNVSTALEFFVTASNTILDLSLHKFFAYGLGIFMIYK